MCVRIAPTLRNKSRRRLRRAFDPRSLRLEGIAQPDVDGYWLDDPAQGTACPACRGPFPTLTLANDSAYGLAGGVWTADPEHGLAVARRIRTGTYTDDRALRDMRASFGGFKASGLDREYGAAGLSAYTE